MSSSSSHSNQSKAEPTAPTKPIRPITPNPKNWAEILPPLLVIGFAATLAIRFFLLGDLALLDPSEGRFAASAQHMLLTGDWVTPKTFDTQAGWEPYWAKPPLLTWLIAGSMKFLGFTEFAARLPSALATVVTLLALWMFTSHFFDRRLALISLLLCCSTVGCYFVSFGVVTDPLLAATVSVAVVAFAFHADVRHPPRSAWIGWLVFLASGLGILTKGPVAAVLIGGTILSWCLAYRRWDALRGLPWISGLTLFFAIVLPWFIIAERATPGFLRYYIVDENFRRYLSADLTEHIRYGSAHRHVHGMSLVFLLLMALPWSLLLVGVRRSSIRSGWASVVTNPWLGFACIWGMFPALFFTLARQILPTYVLPGLPAVSLVLAIMLRQLVDDRPPLRFQALIGSVLGAIGVGMLIAQGRYVAAGTFALLALMIWRSGKEASIENSLKLGLLVPLVFSTALIAVAPRISDTLSTKWLVDWREQQSSSPQVAVLYRRPPSTWFYTGGTGEGFHLGVDPQIGADALAHYSAVAIQRRDLKRMSPAVESEFPRQHEFNDWLLLERR